MVTKSKTVLGIHTALLTFLPKKKKIHTAHLQKGERYRVEGKKNWFRF